MVNGNLFGCVCNDFVRFAMVSCILDSGFKIEITYSGFRIEVNVVLDKANPQVFDLITGPHMHGSGASCGFDSYLASLNVHSETKRPVQSGTFALVLACLLLMLWYGAPFLSLANGSEFVSHTDIECDLAKLLRS